jgi:hypothetical protein
MGCLLKAEGKTKVGSRMMPAVLGFGGRVSRLHKDKRLEVGVGGPPSQKMNSFFVAVPEPPKVTVDEPPKAA